MIKRALLLFTLGMVAIAGRADPSGDKQLQADVVVYKACPGGIMAAVGAARKGARVILVEPTAYVGGIVAQGGLGASDVANYGTIGGLGREFFRRCGDYYKATYGPQSQQLKDSRIGTLEGGQVEPKVAEQVFEEILKGEPNIEVIRGAVLSGVEKKGARIVSISCRKEDEAPPLVIAGKEFIDASYTGDLMAMARVSYMLGSESREQFGESHGRDKPGPQIQAYNYRVTVTKDPANRVPIEKPANYDANAYLADVKLWSKQTYPTPQCLFQYHLPNQKMDSNFADMPGANWDYPEASQAERSRLEVIQRDFSLGFLYFIQNDPRIPEDIRKANQQWGLCRDEFANNGHFPREIYVREARRLNAEYVMREQDTQEHRLKEDSIAIGSISLDCHATQKPDPDLPKRAPKLRISGGMMAPVRPYDISYRSIVPRRGECENLLVPVCLGATHVAWMSIRMEPVLMMTGEAAGLAAKLAIDHAVPVQEAPVSELQTELKKNGGILHAYVEAVPDFDWEPKNPHPGEPVHFFAKPILGTSPVGSYLWNFDGSGTINSKEKDPTMAFAASKGTLVTLVVRDTQGRLSIPVFKIVPVGRKEGDMQLDSDDDGVRGETERSSGSMPYYGDGFGLDMGFNKGRVRKTYTGNLGAAGTYSIYISSSPGGNRSKNTLVQVEHDGKRDSVRVDQSRTDPYFGWAYVGDFAFSGKHPANVTISNAGTEGIVIYDAVRWVLKKTDVPAKR